VLLRIFGLTVMLAMVFMILLSVPAAAQSADNLVPSGTDISFLDFFVVKGGVIAYGLIGLSIVTIALTIEYSLSIRRATMVPAEAIRRTQELIREKRYLEAIKFTAEDLSMMGYVLNAGLTEAAKGYAAMERALEESLDERSARLFRKIEYMNIIGNVSPMIGLFGTVVGMILLFAEIHAADAFPGARDVADRIAVALITTFWGLAIAIPALSIYAVFRNRIDVLTAECALAAEQVLEVFKPSASLEGALTPEAAGVGGPS